MTKGNHKILYIMRIHYNYIGSLQITKRLAGLGCHPGPCDEDVARLRELPEIRRQLGRIDTSSLKKELEEYGAWSEEELSDHDMNLTRILWIACGDIADELFKRNKS
jgi:hypothetical protein